MTNRGIRRVRKDAGLDLARSRSRIKLRSTRVAIGCTRIAEERRAVDATERERRVILNAIALWAALHFSSTGLLTTVARMNAD